MDELVLVSPTEEYREQVWQIRAEFLEYSEGFDGCSGLRRSETYEAWLECNRKKDGDPSGVFLSVRMSDNCVVGIIDYRHVLSEFLLRYGGQVGYSVKLAERRRGYGRQTLRLLLDWLRENNITDRVLVTCGKENEYSRRTIISCGGVLENEVADDAGLTQSGVIQRYYINVGKADFPAD